MSMTIDQEFTSVKKLVEYTLEKYPYTRNSDTKLFFQCCRVLGAKTLEDAERLGLNVISVHKLRQVIQNKEKRFPPLEKTKQKRNEREVEIRKYMKAQ